MREAIEHDLLLIGRHIDELGVTLTWRDLFVLVKWAQPDSATYKAMNPQWVSNAETELLRSIELTNRVLVWQQTKDGHAGRNAPKPHRWPWEGDAKRADGATRGDSVSWEEAEERWGRDMRRRNGIPDPDHDEHKAYEED